MSRPTVNLGSDDWDNNVTKSFPILTPAELNIFPVRFLLPQKPAGLSNSFFDSTNTYILIRTTNSLPKNCGFEVGEYAVLASDFKKVLAGKSHVPNKKEARILRQKSKKK